MAAKQKSGLLQRLMTSSPILRLGFPLKENDISETNSSHKPTLGVFLGSVINILLWPIKRFRRMGRYGKIVTLIVLGLIIYWRVNAYQKSGLEVEVRAAKYGKLVESVNASGEVTAENVANLVFQTAGEVKEVNFKEGERVEKGDIIAKLDTTLLYNAYQSADATLRATQAVLNSTYDTLQGKEKTETYAEISTRTTAEAAKDRAYWAYVSAVKSLEGAYIRAPFDGILTQAPATVVPGTIIALPSSATFQVFGPETTYFRAEVSEVNINKLANGLAADIEIDAFPDQSFEGKVLGFNVSSTTTSTGGTAYVVRISLPDNDKLKFKLGMNGDVDIVISEKDNVLLVPITATIEENSKTFVWVEDEGRAKKVEVTTGSSSIDDIEITSGLTEGTKVITRPPSSIQKGTRLKVTN